MRKVNIDCGELTKVVKANRDKHNAEYLEAKANYRGKVLEALDERRQDIANGADISLYFQLPEPQDHTADYDRVLRMLEMSNDRSIELDGLEFDQYVMDNWSWSQNAKMINTTYLAKGK